LSSVLGGVARPVAESTGDKAGSAADEVQGIYSSRNKQQKYDCVIECY